MNIYESIGVAWVILATTLSTVGVFYMAFCGVRQYAADARTNAAYRVADSEFKSLERTFGK